MVSNTSKETYHKVIKGDKENSENEKVLQYLLSLNGRSATGRQISKATGIENSAVARCLYNLKKANKVYVSIIAKCQITGNRAQHYLPETNI
jgi:hypothetical protein